MSEHRPARVRVTGPARMQPVQGNLVVESERSVTREELFQGLLAENGGSIAGAGSEWLKGASAMLPRASAMDV